MLRVIVSWIYECSFQSVCSPHGASTRAQPTDRGWGRSAHLFTHGLGYALAAASSVALVLSLAGLQRWPHVCLPSRREHCHITALSRGN